MEFYQCFLFLQLWCSYGLSMNEITHRQYPYYYNYVAELKLITPLYCDFEGNPIYQMFCQIFIEQTECARHRVLLFRSSQFSGGGVVGCGGHIYREITNMQVQLLVYEQSTSFLKSYSTCPFSQPSKKPEI